MSKELVPGGFVIRSVNREDCEFPNVEDYDPGDVFVCGECHRRYRLKFGFSTNAGVSKEWTPEA